MALVAVLVVWLLLPGRVAAVAWEAPPAPDWPTNDALASVEVWSTGDLHAPEDLAVDDQGRVYGGVHEGKILRWNAPAATPEVFADTQGRPLGLHFAPDGRLIVADAIQGLLAVSAEGRVRKLTQQCGSTALRFVDDLEITDDGVVYFSDATDRFGFHEWKLDILENGPHGRVCRHDLQTGKTAEVVSGLHFANGVALGPDDAYLLVTETARYRVKRHWLKGPSAGTTEVFVDNLPGFPDGVSSDGDRFWVALASPRNPLLDLLAPHPVLRGAVTKLPEAVQPAPARHAWVIGLDEQGEITHDLQDPRALRYATITSVQRHGDWLYLGSLSEPAAARLPVP